MVLEFPTVSHPILTDDMEESDAAPEEGSSKEKRHEFLLSKISDTIARVSDISPIAYFASTLIGLVTIFLVIGKILPDRILGNDRLSLGLSTIVIIVALLVIQRFYLGSCRNKLEYLRNWQLEIFQNKRKIELLSNEKFKRLDQLLDDAEDFGYFRKVDKFNLEFQEIMKITKKDLGPSGSSPSTRNSSNSI